MIGFLWRATWPWAALLGSAFVVRTALDWLAPPQDFQLRATISTAFGVATLLTAGFWGAWRAGSVAAGLLSGVATSVMAALLSISGVSILLAIWHDPGTMSAIQASGGLTEAYVLPLMMVLPGAVLGSVGGAAAAVVRKLSDDA